MTTFPAVLTAPGTNTFTDHGGILISLVGEDGGMVALGHHDEGAARAAFLQLDDWWPGDDLPIVTTWAVLADPPDHDCVASDTTSCTGCEIGGSAWWMLWNVDEDTPGAFPVMVVEA